ncbi:COP9 signalosome complex subunit 6 [Paragonimus heterotremus]|uniref:COP9 signalosome complex subunit 6 n=1 Tax=Paragonimus heterotremus TaxID=100268 RepID=A0A8J4WDB2_9TREM|nr:COP9 signalosome complex subunit 6 [Paragonimus heterotremus]
MLSNYQAIQMLCTRLHLIRAYVSAVANGELPINQARLREINALTRRLPLLSSYSNNASASGSIRPAKMSDHLFRQANDVCLASLLASLTQGMHTLYNCMVKTTQVIDRRPMPMTTGSGVYGVNPASGFVKMSHFLGNVS